MARQQANGRLGCLAAGWSFFARDERGGVLIVFALALIPILTLTGLAVDHGRASAMKAELQRGLDVAVLAGAQKLAETGKGNEAERAVRLRFEATQAAKLDVHLKITADGRKGKVTASVDHAVPTLFLAVAGLERLEIAATATAGVTAPRQNRLAAPRGTMPASRAPQHAIRIDDFELRRLIARVDEVCSRIAAQGLSGLVPQCQSVFDGSFERRLRRAIATNDDPAALLPAGVRLME